MKVTLLGTGTSSGVPVLTCECEVCQSKNEKDSRLRVSVLIQSEGLNIIIDSGPDFRYQVLKTKINKLDAIIYTHEHKDHTAGLDDVRPFNYLQGEKYLNIYARESVLNQLKREFHYAFKEQQYHGIPLIKTNIIDAKPFKIENLEIIPIEVMHHKLPVFGFRIKDFSYITDANFISKESLDIIKGSKVVVLNALQKKPHISHFTLEESISMAKQIGAKNTYFTHISHNMGLHNEVNKELPEGMELAYDEMTFEI